MMHLVRTIIARDYHVDIFFSGVDVCKGDKIIFDEASMHHIFEILGEGGSHNVLGSLISLSPIQLMPNIHTMLSYIFTRLMTVLLLSRNYSYIGDYWK